MDIHKEKFKGVLKDISLRGNHYFIWKHFLIIENKEYYTNKIKYILNEYGTSLYCNRFDVGNCIEFIVTEMLKSTKLNVEEFSNAKRYDIIIDNKYQLSIKYSSSGDITLHNSNSQTNKDTKFNNLLLLIKTKIYFITKHGLREYGINVNDYLKNAGDSLKLKRKILTELDKKNYQYQIDFNIETKKEDCKNKLCSKAFYNIISIEYENLK